MGSDEKLPQGSGSSSVTTLVVQDPSETLRELTDLDKLIQDVDEDIVAKRAALTQAMHKKAEMVAQLRAKIRAADTPMPILPLFDASGPSTDVPPVDPFPGNPS